MQLSRLTERPLLRLLGGALFLFLLNVWVCRELFSVEFTERIGSIEASYMSISHWAAAHWGDLTWFPLWFDGLPFRQVYQPGFHLSVAALQTLSGWTTQHAYHFTVALEYCLGPVTLFLLCAWAFDSKLLGFVSGLLYSLFSPVSFLVPIIRADTNHLLTARRFIVLVRYGEGPHLAALLLLPVVILALHFAVSRKHWWGVAAGAIALALVPLTNWPGTVGLSMAIAAYALARFGDTERAHWPTFAGVAIIAYLLACPWIPPAVIAIVQRNAHQSDDTTFAPMQIWLALGIVVALFLLRYVLGRLNANTAIRFFAYFTLISGVISVGHEWFGWRILPQAGRFHMEFEMAACGLIAALALVPVHRMPVKWRAVVAAIFLAVSVREAKHLRHYAKTEIRPLDMTQRIEYRMARWFDSNMHGQRVYAPGNVSLWMNMFTDTPQMAGCCDQSMPSQEYRISTFQIYTGMNAGPQSGAIATLWLKAYGNDAVGVSGPKSQEVFHPFTDPLKFEGLLPVLWRSGDDVVYDVQRRSRSLAHVVERNNLVLHPPEGGLDTAALIPYVTAIESPDAPAATFDWVGLHQARIVADIPPGRVVSVQVTYDPAWHASLAGKELPISSDALSMLVIDPSGSGHCVIDLTWNNSARERWLNLAALFGIVLLIVWSVVRFRGNQTQLHSSPSL